MKLWKRLAAAAIALAMSASVWTMVACEDKPDNGGNSQNNGQNDGNTPGNNNPGDNNPDNPGSNNPGGNDQGTVADGEVAEIISALKAQELETVKLNYDISMAADVLTKLLDADGSYLSDYCTQKETVEMEMELKMNVPDGDMDMMMFTQQSDKTHYIETGEDRYYKSADVDYIFLRGWNSFSYYVYDSTDENNGKLDVEKVIDWSKVTLDYDGSAAEIMPVEAWTDILGYEPRVNIMYLNLAYATDAVTVANGKAVIDFNKLIDVMLEDLSGALSVCTSTTTVGKILENGAVKKYLSAIVNVFTVEELRTLLQTYLAYTPVAEIANSILAIEPDENSTTYDYLLKILASEELYNIINQLLDDAGVGVVLPATVNNITLAFLINTIGKVPNNEVADYIVMAQQFVAEISESVTATEMTMEVMEGMTITAKNLKMEYTLNDDYSISSQSITADIERSGILSHGYKSEYDEATDEWIEIETNHYVGTESISVAATVEYTSEKATLIDISGCTVEEYEYKVLDGTYSEEYGAWFWVEEFTDSGYAGLTGSIMIKDGAVAGISVTDENGNVLTTELDEPFSFEVTVHDWREDKEYTATVTVYATIYCEYNDNGELYYASLVLKYPKTEDDYHLASAEWERITYHNTVAGVLNGAEWTEIAD